MLRIFKRIPLLCCLLAMGFSQGALAQADKPLRLVLGFPAGSTPDALAALIQADTAKWAQIIKAKQIVGE